MFKKLAIAMALTSAVTAQQIRVTETPTSTDGGTLQVVWKKFHRLGSDLTGVVVISHELVPAYPVVPGASLCVSLCGLYLWSDLRGCRQRVNASVPAGLLPPGMTFYLQGVALDPRSGRGSATNIVEWETR